MKHQFKPYGGFAENPGVFDNGHGGLLYVAECACGVVRKRGIDYTGARPENNWGPRYYDSQGQRIARTGGCPYVDPRRHEAKSYAEVQP